ncbi:hypothetical protein Droror1_Dr00009422 [Drosera rotundifolia]
MIATHEPKSIENDRNSFLKQEGTLQSQSYSNHFSTHILQPVEKETKNSYITPNKISQKGYVFNRNRIQRSSNPSPKFNKTKYPKDHHIFLDLHRDHNPKP